MEINGQVADLTISTASSDLTRCRDEKKLPARWVAALFAKLQARYGQKWTSNYPAGQVLEAALNEWATELGDLQGEDIAFGLKAWKDKWPPSVHEFKEACLGHRPQAQCHKSFPEYPRPSKRLSTKERSLRSYLDQIREERRNAEAAQG